VLAAILILSIKFPLNKTLSLLLFLVFLLNASSTGDDYDFYKMGFESVTLTDDFPYIHTDHLDSEPIYLFFMLLGKFVTSNFNVFLALSFVAWVLLLRAAILKLGFKSDELRFILLCAFPAVIPVVTYWSPRSAFSLPLILLAYYFLTKRAFLIGAVFSLMAILFHSQYIPFVLALIITIIISSYFSYSVLMNAIFASLVILSLLRFGVNIISSLPLQGTIFSFALYKFHYFEDVSNISTIRPSGILIIFLDLSYLLYFRRKIFLRSLNENGGVEQGSKKTLQNLLDTAIAFSVLTNLFFLHDAHVAGRVARFADYFIMCVGLPFVVRTIFTNRTANGLIVIYAVLSLIAFQNIYIFLT
jgi:hypothetical protein